jgi:hypothetical protein
MKIENLACPTCGAPLPGHFVPDRPTECENCGSLLMMAGMEVSKLVLCPQCQTVNTIDKRYCLSCGGSLKMDCILCHAENIVGAVHCAICGAHLERARQRRMDIQDARQRHREERDRVLREKETRQREEKLQRLLEALDEPENHEFAIYQINQMGANAVEAVVETLLNDHDPDARYGSARALGQICSQPEVKGLIKSRSAKALIKALEDDESAVRYWSADALGKCKSVLAIEPLAELLGDNHAGVRERAKLALEQIGTERAREILAERSKGLLGWIKGN